MDFVSFHDWTQNRALPFLGTNAGADILPFQGWQHFKEAYAPEVVERAISESRIEVRNCLDPFGGSGTTALACQFLGVSPITIEVNPFLADLIEAKLSKYDSDAVARDFGTVIRLAKRRKGNPKKLFELASMTFLEPGVDQKWIFDYAVGARIDAHLSAIDELQNKLHRRLFRVLLGGILIDVSNVVISGKGRRYRRGDTLGKRHPHEVDYLFHQAVNRAIVEIHAYAARACHAFKVLRGDSRQLISVSKDKIDLAAFSPPYPNSFDYSDVYNVELWTLGYLTDTKSNGRLRRSTLSSHVQIKREFSPAPKTSRSLTRALNSLEAARPTLWNRWIPEMVGAYFHDLQVILGDLYPRLSRGAKVWMIVGDSKYASIPIKVAKIISEIAPTLRYKVESSEPFRSMRASPQQGGNHELAETLIVLSKG